MPYSRFSNGQAVSSYIPRVRITYTLSSALRLMSAVPTCLLYEQGDVLAWGLEAKNAQPMEGTTKCEWCALFSLYPLFNPNSYISRTGSNSSSPPEPSVPKLPPMPAFQVLSHRVKNRSTLSLITWDGCGSMRRSRSLERLGGMRGRWVRSLTSSSPELVLKLTCDVETADIWLTTPASWDAEGRSLMLEAALRAHLVYPSGPENREWKGRLKLGITYVVPSSRVRLALTHPSLLTENQRQQQSTAPTSLTYIG